SESEDETAFSARHRGSFNKSKSNACYNCKGYGHFAYECPSRNNSNRGRGRGRGRGHGRGQYDETGWLTEHAFHTRAEKSNLWFVDSAATRFMCNNEDSFCEMTNYDTASRILTADGSAIEANGVGKVQISTDCGFEFPLNDVIYAKDLAANLLSVRQITKRGNTVLFSGNNCTIKNRYGEVVLTA